MESGGRRMNHNPLGNKDCGREGDFRCETNPTMQMDDSSSWRSAKHEDRQRR